MGAEGKTGSFKKIWRQRSLTSSIKSRLRQLGRTAWYYVMSTSVLCAVFACGFSIAQIWILHTMSPFLLSPRLLWWTCVVTQPSSLQISSSSSSFIYYHRDTREGVKESCPSLQVSLSFSSIHPTPTFSCIDLSDLDLWPPRLCQTCCTCLMLCAPMSALLMPAEEWVKSDKAPCASATHNYHSFSHTHTVFFLLFLSLTHTRVR